MAPMANQIKDAFESRKGQATASCSGSRPTAAPSAEGERVIEVLRQIKATHELETAVTQGDVCASMCVFIYVQGQKRYGALTSSWLFHEVSHMTPSPSRRPNSIVPPGSGWSTDISGRQACPMRGSPT